MRLSRCAQTCLWLYDALPRACLGLILVALLLQLAHQDRQRCAAILSSGSWPPHDTLASWRPYFFKWEPRGCTMREYEHDDFTSCLAGRQLTFVGDSTVRQLFYSAAKRLDRVRADENLMDVLVSENPQRDVELNIDNVRLVFIWDPWLNSTGLVDELNRFSPQPTAESAALLVVGAPGLWAARNGGDAYFDLFAGAIDNIRPYLDHPLDPGGPSFDRLHNQIVVHPVQVPRYRKLSPARAQTLTRPKIRHMNNYLAALPARQAAHVVSAYNLMTRVGTRFAFEDSGIHVREALADRKIDLLLNLRCNQGIVDRTPDARETCCVAAPRLSRGLILIILVVSAVALFALRRRASLPSRHVRPVLTLCGVLLYCYVTDRTQLLPKMDKRLGASALATALVTAGVVGAASICRWRPGSDNHANGHPKSASALPSRLLIAMSANGQDDADPGFMPREISDEWKGWMQVLLLILSYQDVSDQMWAYKMIRWLGANYLFISTYGHATYFLRTNDYSLRRAATVVWRLNALPFLLSVVMASSGSLYSFQRLATFWFLVTYVTMRLGHHRLQGNPAFLLLKATLAALFVTVLVQTPFVFDALGRILDYVLPGTNYNAQAARARIEVDRLVPCVAMIVAILAHRVAALHSAHARVQSTRAHMRSPHPGTPLNDDGSSRLPPPRASALSAAGTHSIVDRAIATLVFPESFPAFVVWPVLVTLSGILGFGLFFALTQVVQDVFPEREGYDFWHPYLSILPVVAYALVRNAHPAVRRIGLGAAARVARIALELDVLKRHVFFARDGTVLLRLGLGWRGRGGGAWWAADLLWTVETAALLVLLVSCAAHARAAVVTLGRWLFGDAGDFGNLDDGGGRDAEGHEMADMRAREVEGSPGKKYRSEARVRGWRVREGLWLKVGVVVGVVWLVSVVS